MILTHNSDPETLAQLEGIIDREYTNQRMGWEVDTAELVEAARELLRHHKDTTEAAKDELKYAEESAEEAERRANGLQGQVDELRTELNYLEEDRTKKK